MSNGGSRVRFWLHPQTARDVPEHWLCSEKLCLKKKGEGHIEPKTLVMQENTQDMLTAVDTSGTSNETFAQFQARESRWDREMMDNFNVLAFDLVMHVLHRSRGLADHDLGWVSVSSTRPSAVDRELPSRVTMIKSVCSAADMISTTFTPYSRNLGSGSARTTSLCHVPRIVRMSVARICAVPISAA